MRILAVAPYYDPEGGGLERYAHNILKRLAARGHGVRVLTFTKKSAVLVMKDGVAVERIVPVGFIGNAGIHPDFRSRVSRAIREFDPSVVVAHTPVPFAAEMAYEAARRANIPFVTTYHGGSLRGSSLVLNGLANLDRFTLERRMLDGSTRLIAVSPYVKEHALLRQRDRVTIISPGVDAERFSLGPTPRGRDILFVGPLDSKYRWKGLDTLWSAFRQVKAAVPEARMVLVGSGDRHAEFLKRVQHSDSDLRVTGRLSDDELIEEYRKAAGLVLPSTTDAESFGMVLAEANACGCPVVGSDVGGIPDFINHGDNGLLARPGDAEDLADRIIEVLEDADDADLMGQRGRDRVVAEHDWDDLAARTEKVLLEAARFPSEASRLFTRPPRPNASAPGTSATSTQVMTTPPSSRMPGQEASRSTGAAPTAMEAPLSVAGPAAVPSPAGAPAPLVALSPGEPPTPVASSTAASPRGALPEA